MNYQKHYDNLVETRKKRTRAKDAYYERHHIVMRSMGGNDDPENLVYLTAREHFLAHWLLWRIHRNREAAFAFHCIHSWNSSRLRMSSKSYQESREAFSLHLSMKMTGVPLSEQTRKRMSMSSPRLSGEDHPMYGKKHSEQTRAQMKANSPHISGKDHPMYGKKWSEEMIEHFSEKSAGENNPMFGKSVLEVWTDRYGETIALEKWKESNERRSMNGKKPKSEETKERMKAAALKRWKNKRETV